MTDLEAFVCDIQGDRELYVGKRLDGTRRVVKLEDYVKLMIQHTDGTALYVNKKTYRDMLELTKSLTAYLRKYHDGGGLSSLRGFSEEEEKKDRRTA